MGKRARDPGSRGSHRFKVPCSWVEGSAGGGETGDSIGDSGVDFSFLTASVNSPKRSLLLFIGKLDN